MTLNTIEDAVLTALGEQELGTEEITETGTPAWGCLERLSTSTVAHAPKPKGVLTPFNFPRRRSANELPWASIAKVAP